MKQCNAATVYLQTLYEEKQSYFLAVRRRFNNEVLCIGSRVPSTLSACSRRPRPCRTGAVSPKSSTISRQAKLPVSDSNFFVFSFLAKMFVLTAGIYYNQLYSVPVFGIKTRQFDPSALNLSKRISFLFLTCVCYPISILSSFTLLMYNVEYAGRAILL